MVYVENELYLITGENMCACVFFQSPLLDKKHGVGILCMCPGVTDTFLFARGCDAYENLNVGRQVVLSSCSVQR
jgi:hypothetical protein